MLPNNPFFVERLIKEKQEEIQRETGNFTGYEFQRIPLPRARASIKSIMTRITILFVVLVWLFSLIA